jgi:hypothetical protein
MEASRIELQLRGRAVLLLIFSFFCFLGFGSKVADQTSLPQYE